MYGRNAYGTTAYGTVRGQSVSTVQQYLSKVTLKVFMTFKKLYTSNIN